MLQGTTAVIIFGVLCFAVHNLVRYVIILKVNQFFIVAFYVLALFCLTAWFITAVAQSYEPRTRYLVFQLIDDPKYFHITADLAQSA